MASSLPVFALVTAPAVLLARAIRIPRLLARALHAQISAPHPAHSPRASCRPDQWKFREKLAALVASGRTLPAVPDAVWDKDWGVHLQPFGSGERAIQYPGAYVSRTAIGDSRIAGLTNETVSFRWKDRANGGVPRIETLSGIDFVRRYLQHVLPRGMKAIRYFGFCHPAAKTKRLKIAAATGCPPPVAPVEKPAAPPRPCPCCGEAMIRVLRLIPSWRRAESTSGTGTRSARPPPLTLEIPRA